MKDEYEWSEYVYEESKIFMDIDCKKYIYKVICRDYAGKYISEATMDEEHQLISKGDNFDINDYSLY